MRFNMRSSLHILFLILYRLPRSSFLGLVCLILRMIHRILPLFVILPWFPAIPIYPIPPIVNIFIWLAPVSQYSWPLVCMQLLSY